MQVKLAWAILITFIVSTVIVTILWWQREFYTEHTKQAYVQGHSIQITAPYEGVIEQINVKPFSTVKSDDVLFIMEDNQLQAEYDVVKAEHDYAVSEYKLLKKKKGHELQHVDLLEQKLEAAQKKYHHISDLINRYQQLDARDIAGIEYARVKATQADAAQNYLTVKAELKKSHKTYKELTQQLNSMKAKINMAAANMQAKQRQVVKKIITAPMGGVVGEIKIQRGQLVKAHDILVQLFYGNDRWISADFSEKQIKQLKIGQTATVYLDAYPKSPLKAKIKLFAPATKRELEQSPFPEQYGQILRVEQLFPVIIEIDEPNPLADVMKPGMSATVVIDTLDSDKSNTKHEFEYSI